jgi:hypothetical protein
LGWFDAHDEVQGAVLEILQERLRRRHGKAEVDVVMFGAKSTEDVGEVNDGGNVDHSEADMSSVSKSEPVGP